MILKHICTYIYSFACIFYSTDHSQVSQPWFFTNFLCTNTLQHRIYLTYREHSYVISLLFQFAITPFYHISFGKERMFLLTLWTFPTIDHSPKDCWTMCTYPPLTTVFFNFYISFTYGIAQISARICPKSGLHYYKVGFLGEIWLFKSCKWFKTKPTTLFQI